MEFSKTISSYLKIDQDGFLICNGNNYLTKLKHSNKQSNTNNINNNKYSSTTSSSNNTQGLKLFAEIINTFGSRSAKSQGLKQVITSFDRFVLTDQRIYIKIQQKENKVLGFVKTGQKNLFYRDYIGNIKQLKPTCVLDIYVHQSCQRNGVGKEIFERFLKEENKIPQKLAYDRPSQKLIGFLKKHYNLVKYIPQNNNYVIFDRYFSSSGNEKIGQLNGNNNNGFEASLSYQKNSKKENNVNTNIVIPSLQQQKQEKKNNNKDNNKPKTSTQVQNKRIKADSQPHNTNNQAQNQKNTIKTTYPQDSIQILKKEISSVKNNQNIHTLRGFKNIIGNTHNIPPGSLINHQSSQSPNLVVHSAKQFHDNPMSLSQNPSVDIKQNKYYNNRNSGVNSSLRVGYGGIPSNTFSINNNNNTNNQTNNQNQNWNTPWALNSDKKNFRTTSGAYGSHYQYYK